MPKDFIIDGDHVPKIVRGDFTVGDSTAQHQQLLLESQKGDWRENPWVGVGLGDWVNSDGYAGLINAIQSQFEKDGMRVEEVGLDDELKLVVQANYPE